MKTVPTAAAALLGMVVASGGAVAATTVIGGGLARSCYEAARDDNANQANVMLCDRALTEEALRPSDRVATHVNRGILKLQMRNLDAALADFDRASVLDPKEPEAYLNKGVAVLTREDWSAARTLFDNAIAHETRRPELAYYGRALANEAAGDVKAAYRDFKRAAELAPKWAEPTKELARFSVVKRGS